MNELTIHDYLQKKGLSEYGIAGLMGNLFAESGLNPRNLQNSYENVLGMNDNVYVAAVDNGTYTNFVPGQGWLWPCSVDVLDSEASPAGFC